MTPTQPECPHPGAAILREIFTERERQIVHEGYDERHDDQHASGTIAAAAGVYALFTTFTDADRHIDDETGYPANKEAEYFVDKTWPWDMRAFKPKDRRRDLIRAAALLVAEIERLDRVAMPTEADFMGEARE